MSDSVLSKGFPGVFCNKYVDDQQQAIAIYGVGTSSAKQAYHNHVVQAGTKGENSGEI